MKKLFLFSVVFVMCSILSEGVFAQVPDAGVLATVRWPEPSAPTERPTPAAVRAWLDGCDPPDGATFVALYPDTIFAPDQRRARHRGQRLARIRSGGRTRLALLGADIAEQDSRCAIAIFAEPNATRPRYAYEGTVADVRAATATGPLVQAWFTSNGGSYGGGGMLALYRNGVIASARYLSGGLGVDAVQVFPGGVSFSAWILDDGMDLGGPSSRAMLVLNDGVLIETLRVPVGFFSFGACWEFGVGQPPRDPDSFGPRCLRSAPGYVRAASDAPAVAALSVARTLSQRCEDAGGDPPRRCRYGIARYVFDPLQMRFQRAGAEETRTLTGPIVRQPR